MTTLTEIEQGEEWTTGHRYTYEQMLTSLCLELCAYGMAMSAPISELMYLLKFSADTHTRACARMALKIAVNGWCLKAVPTA